MTGQNSLLGYATDLLDGKISIGASAPRTAALLARCALEEWLDQKSHPWSSTSYPYPTTTSKLIALEVLEDGDLGARARRLWSALSKAVHHHAYELQPSAAEVRHLVNQVRALDADDLVPNH